MENKDDLLLDVGFVKQRCEICKNVAYFKEKRFDSFLCPDCLRKQVRFNELKKMQAERKITELQQTIDKIGYKR